MNNISRRLIASLMLVIASLWLEHSLSVEHVNVSILYASAIHDLFIVIGILILLSLPFALSFPHSTKMNLEMPTKEITQESTQNLAQGSAHNPKSSNNEAHTNPINTTIPPLHSDNKDEVLR